MPLKTHQDDLPAINLTPMIDIVFNLIIFFMVSTRFTEIERKVDLSVPRVGGTAGLSEVQKTRTINIYRDGAIVLDSQPVTLTELRSILAAAHRQYEGLKVTIRGDGLATHQSVAAVIVACQQAGIVELGFAVAPGDPTTKAR
ncbi:MAG: biopolymer transporter ExbD [Planctomycetia bacterium]|jgi:biopolymer transport protein ExbD|nr:biopolymer transporter ExbD [Planctomycetia bacterium]